MYAQKLLRITMGGVEPKTSDFLYSCRSLTTRPPGLLELDEAVVPSFNHNYLISTWRISTQSDMPMSVHISKPFRTSVLGMFMLEIHSKSEV